MLTLTAVHQTPTSAKWIISYSLVLVLTIRNQKYEMESGTFEKTRLLPCMISIEILASFNFSSMSNFGELIVPPDQRKKIEDTPLAMIIFWDPFISSSESFHFYQIRGGGRVHSPAGCMPGAARNELLTLAESFSWSSSSYMEIHLLQWNAISFRELSLVSPEKFIRFGNSYYFKWPGHVIRNFYAKIFSLTVKITFSQLWLHFNVKS